MSIVHWQDVSDFLEESFPRWFDVIFPEGIPPYYLRHNRATRITDITGREAARKTLGHRSELTTNRYIHLTKKKREETGKSLMKSAWKSQEKLKLNLS